MAANKTKRLGINNYKTKLSDAQVLEIRERAANGEKATTLSKEFGCAYNTVRMIILGQRRSTVE